MRRLASLGALFGIAAILQGTPVALSQASPAVGECGVPATGQIDVSELANVDDVVECGVVGRAVDLGEIVLEVPTPGEGVSVNAQGDTESGGLSAYIFAGTDGQIHYSSDGATTVSSAAGPSNYDKDGCDSNYMGATKVWEFHGTFNFYVDNEGQPGGSAYSPADTGAALEKAGKTWHDEMSPCYPEDHSLAGSLNYAGATTWNGDFKIANGTSTCADRDGKSTIDTGNLDMAGPGTMVGLNCTWYNDDERVVESDIRFNVTDEDFTYSPGSDSCDNNDYDVLSVMTHETGHTYGMKDKGGDVNYYQTMFESSFPCRAWARNLGRSDVKHLRAQYPE